MALKPSEYFARNCAVAPSSTHRSEIEMRHEIGVDRLLFGTDYPHHEGTWPNTRAWIQVAFEGVSEDEARRMLGENAIELYGLDGGALGEVADQIGPLPADVLVDHHTVEQGLIDHFHKRAGFSRPADAVDVESVSADFADDLARIAGAR
jgi:Amidohydrolase